MHAVEHADCVPLAQWCGSPVTRVSRNHRLRCTDKACLISHQHVLAPLILKVLAAPTRERSKQPSDRGTERETYGLPGAYAWRRSQHRWAAWAFVAGKVLTLLALRIHAPGKHVKQVLAAVQLDPRCRAIDYARVMASLRQLQDDGDILECATDVFDITPTLR